MTSLNINKRYDIWNLINSGIHLQPDKIKITYRYKKAQDENCHVYAFGLIPDATKPVMLAYGALLYDSKCPRERAMTTILELNNVLKVTDIYIIIAHYELLQDVYSITGVWDSKDIQLGRGTTDVEFDCGT